MDKFKRFNYVYKHPYFVSFCPNNSAVVELEQIEKEQRKIAFGAENSAYGGKQP